jgi:hypothetical protein
MGLVIMGGIAIGNIFTLFAVPGMYMLLAADHARANRGEGLPKGGFPTVPYPPLLSLPDRTFSQASVFSQVWTSAGFVMQIATLSH